MDYMYGQLYKQIKEIEYKGRNSETTIVTVDQKTKTIRVDVKILSPEQLPKDEGNYVLLVEVDENGKHTLKWVSTQSTLDRIKELEDKTYKLTYDKDTDTSTFDSNVTINKDLNVEGNTTFNNKVTILNPPVDATDATNRDYVDNSIETHFTDLNIENSTGGSSLRQKYKVDNLDYSAVAPGLNAAAFGGKRWDMLTDSSKTPTSAEGNQSFAAGGSVHAIGDFSAVFGKDTVARQRVSFAAGSSIAGMTEDEFNRFFWDSTSNVGIRGGSKNENGQVCDFTGAPYERSYAFATALGCDCEAKGPRSFAAGDNSHSIGTGSIALGSNVWSSGANSFTIGNHTSATGTCSFSGGIDSISAGNYSLTFGQQDTAPADFAVSIGYNCRADGKYSIALQKDNLAADTAEAGTVIGIGNAVSGRGAFAGGIYMNSAKGKASLAFGQQCAANGDYSVAVGFGALASTDGQIAVGIGTKYNESAQFIVGNGTLDNRNNAFEVLKDGRAKVQTAPKDNDDVARLKELKNTESKLNENIIKDPNKTYIVFNDSEVTLNVTIEASVDWGDGSKETIEGKKIHIYNDNVAYHLISITNITEFESGIITPQSGVIRIKLSDKIKSITNTDSYPSLIRIDFPDYLHTIGGSCFAWSTSLQEIRLGYSIQSIDLNAFFGCTNLSKVYIKTITPPAAGISIFGNAPIKKIVVPKESIEAYKTADGWKDWSDKIVYEVDSSDVDLKLDKLPVNTFGGNKVVYGWEPTNSTATSGTVTSYKLSSDTSENSIAYRDSSGKLQASAGTTTDDVATFGQLESTSNALQANIDKKIDLVESDTAIALKNNSTISYTSSATASTIMQRDSNGRVEIEDGINNKDGVNKSQLDTKLDLTGGTLTGDLTIQDANVEITKTAEGKGNLTVGGNLRVNGTTTTVDAETLAVKDNLIVTNSGNTELVNLSGLAIKTGSKDADENAIAYGILYDPATSADSVKLGLGSINKTTNEFTFKTATDANPVATRDDSTKLTANHLLVWNNAKHTLIDANNLTGSITPASLGLTNFVLDGGEITA